MHLRNSDVRRLAADTRHSNPEQAGGLSWIIAALVIILPATCAYYFGPAIMARIKGQTPVVAKITPPTELRASIPAIPPTGPESPPPAAAKAPEAVPVPKLTDDQRRQYANATLSIYMNSDLTEEYSRSMFEQIGDGNSARRTTVNPNDLFAYCREQTRNLAVSNYVRRKKDDDTTFVDTMTEALICVMTRRPDRLCEPKIRERMVKQIKLYAVVRDEAVIRNDKGEPLAKAGDAGHFDRAVHRTATKEIRTLAAKGFITLKDFGWSTPKYLSEAIGEYKGTKLVCAGA